MSWKKMENGPLHLAGASMFQWNNSIYVLGGISSESEMNQKIIRFDLEDQVWTEFECTGWIPRSNFGVGVFDDSVYVLFGWKDFEFKYEPSVLKLDLEACKFDKTSISVSSDLLVQNYGFAQSDNKLYIFGGLSSVGVTNALQQFSKSSKAISTITGKSSSPKNLMNASLTHILTYLYLFGGMYKETRYNDLWRFDLQSLKWTKLKSYGDIPSPRSHHSATSDGDILIIFGGKDANQYYNDGYQFNTLTLTWSLLKYGEHNPSARFSACMVARLPLVYIYGGETLSGFSLTLYKYNISDATYAKVSDSYGFTPGNGQICFLNEDGDEFRVLYGTADGDQPLGYITRFNFTSMEWSTLFDPDSETTSRARPIIAEVKEKYYITGGSTWATSPKREIFVLDSKSKKIKLIGELDQIAYQAPSARFKSKVFIYGGGSAYNELIRYDIATHEFISFDLLDICTDDCSYVCSVGTYFNKTTKACELCPPGYYADFKGASSCKECSRGTYNDKFGATSQRQCYPCNQDQYSPHNASTMCIDCQAGFYCPIGSSKPTIRLDEDLVTSSQPTPFYRRTDEANLLIMNIQIGIGMFGLLILLCMLPFAKFRGCITEMDKFDDAHNYEDEVPLVTRKTFIGGIFTCFYLILAIIVIVGSIILFNMDNVLESKSLIPFVVLQELTSSVTGDVEVDVSLGNYGGYCIDLNEDGEEICSKSIFYSMSSFDNKKTTFECKKIDTDCELKLVIKDFEIEAETILYISLQEMSSYTSRIAVSVSADSSIPDEKSEVKMVAYPQRNKVFRGDTPTLFKFSFTPSYFTSEEDGSELTGYHVAPLADPSGGTSYEPTNLGFSSDLQIKIVFERSINGLRTERTLAFTAILLLLTLIGSIPGIKDMLGSAMEYVEEKYLNHKENEEKNKQFGVLKDRRRDNLEFFKDSMTSSFNPEVTVPDKSKMKKSDTFINSDI
jgi:hypothetical protein